MRQKEGERKSSGGLGGDREKGGTERERREEEQERRREKARAREGGTARAIERGGRFEAAKHVPRQSKHRSNEVSHRSR